MWEDALRIDFGWRLRWKKKGWEELQRLATLRTCGHSGVTGRDQEEEDSYSGFIAIVIKFREINAIVLCFELGSSVFAKWGNST